MANKGSGNRQTKIELTIKSRKQTELAMDDFLW